MIAVQCEFISLVGNNTICVIMKHAFDLYIYDFFDYRNPSNQSRPSFSAISRDYLRKSTESLLQWSPEDGNLSPGVGVCGAPLTEAFDLYSELQRKYSS